MLCRGGDCEECYSLEDRPLRRFPGSKGSLYCTSSDIPKYDALKSRFKMFLNKQISFCLDERDTYKPRKHILDFQSVAVEDN